MKSRGMSSVVTASAPSSCAISSAEGRASCKVSDLGHVLTNEPESGMEAGVVCEHDPKRSYTSQLGQSTAPIGPVVHRKHGACGVHDAVANGQCLSDRANGWGSVLRPLADHLGGWFDSEHDPIVTRSVS